MTTAKMVVEKIEQCERPLAVSHIDTDGITALAIAIKLFERLGLRPVWSTIPQLNAETVVEVMQMVRSVQPDLLLFTDLGTGQMQMIIDKIVPMGGLRSVIVIDHHLPQERDAESLPSSVIELNPNIYGLSGSRDVSSAGIAFLTSYVQSRENIDLSELAIVGASGDLQDYYGSGLTGLNAAIVREAVKNGLVRIDRDLTFFGINTRPLPFLLEFATEPYLPGITGNRDACFQFFEERGIPLKDENDRWRTWSDLNDSEKRIAVQGLVQIVLQFYDDPRIASGIIGDVYTLLRRPQNTEMRSAKEFSTLLNACGRNRRASVAVEICLGSAEAFKVGRSLLQTHRANLAQALRRIETGGYKEMSGMYVINDPLTPDTIIGIVIGMAQGSRLVPIDRPVIGVSTNTTDGGARVKISGRAGKGLVERGVNLKEVFVTAAMTLNRQLGRDVAEGGGHPMAAGAFVNKECLDDFLDIVSTLLCDVIGDDYASTKTSHSHTTV